MSNKGQPGRVILALLLAFFSQILKVNEVLPNENNKSMLCLNVELVLANGANVVESFW